MPWRELAVAVVAAAAGQVLLKAGAGSGLVNPKVGAGLLLYAVSACFWVAALGRAPLSKVYPFTAATFVLVMAGSWVVFREPWGWREFAGAGLVLAGLWVLSGR
jgi:undecaprenyl phosphate-alpha-L-ara4N flippase subunit ArnE